MDPGYPKDIIRNWRGIPRNIDAVLTSVFDGMENFQFCQTFHREFSLNFEVEQQQQKEGKLTLLEWKHTGAEYNFQSKNNFL